MFTKLVKMTNIKSIGKYKQLGYKQLDMIYTKDGVLETEIQTFIAKSGSTANRVKSSQPQLQCIGGTAAKMVEYHPNQILCKNVGTNYNGKVLWLFNASSLSRKVKLSNTQISFESNGEYVKPDSGIVKYHLDLKKGLLCKIDDNIIFFIICLCIIIVIKNIIYHYIGSPI